MYHFHRFKKQLIGKHNVIIVIYNLILNDVCSLAFSSCVLNVNQTKRLILFYLSWENFFLSNLIQAFISYNQFDKPCRLMRNIEKESMWNDHTNRFRHVLSDNNRLPFCKYSRSTLWCFSICCVVHLTVLNDALTIYVRLNIPDKWIRCDNINLC